MHAVAPSAIRKLTTDLALLGLDSRALLAELGVRPGQGPLGLDHFLGLKASAAAALADPCLGLTMAGQTEIGRWELLGYLIRNQTDLGGAAHAFLRYQALWQSGLCVTLDLEHGDAVIRYSLPPGCRGLGAWVDVQQSLAEMYLIGGHIAGERLPVAAVRLCQPAPVDRSPFSRIFGPGHIEFSAPENALHLPAEVLERPIPHADPGLTPYLEMAAEKWRARSGVGAPTLVERLEALIRDVLPEVPDLDRVARSLGVSKRTLARRIDEADTSWRAILDSTRRRLVEGLIADADVPLGEVAWRLGYGSPSSFNRAFQRWFGTTPGAYRAALPADES